MITYIGISGGIGAGKDTLADGLERAAPALWPRQPFVRLAFSDLIKEICISAFRASRDEMFGSQNDKRKIIPNLKVSNRDALKIVGKAYCDIDPNFWVRQAFEMSHSMLHQLSSPSTGVVVFTDARFENEVDAIHMRGGKVIWLARKGGTEAEQAHPTENALGNANPDLRFDNSKCEANVTLATTIHALKKWGLCEQSF